MFLSFKSRHFDWTVSSMFSSSCIYIGLRQTKCFGIGQCFSKLIKIAFMVHTLDNVMNQTMKLIIYTHTASKR